MKRVIIHGDGMADWPCPELGGKTPLEAAHKPNMELIASRGKLGLVATIPEGMAAGSDIGTMSILGYDPRRYHTGRAPLEAASRGIALSPSDVVFRMNLVTLRTDADGTTIMDDFTSGHITTGEAAVLVRDLARHLGGDGVEFFNGVGYRHLMVWHNGPTNLRLAPPHDITGRPIAPYLPAGEGAQRLRELMTRSSTVLRDHPINLKRRAQGNRETTSIWFWGHGRAPSLPTLESRFKTSGAVISAVDLVNGLGQLAGLERIKVPGATGFLDTDYAAKARHGLKALEKHDFLLLHIEAPDEAGHMGRADLKREAIERIDELIVGPMLKGLREMGDFRLLLMPDHATPCKLKTHSNEPVPFAMISLAQLVRNSGDNRRYCENDARLTGLVVRQGHELIEELFRDDV
jgi:2,3-bisphosphoglycerate-independent phosphoglycerate mutase